MRAKRKAWWLLVPLVGTVAVACVVQGRDAFDELGPPVPDAYAPETHRRWALPGSEAEVRRRVESALAKDDAGWRLVSQLNESLGGATHLSYYMNRELGGDCNLQYIPARKPGDRAFVDLDKPRGWQTLQRRAARWWRRWRP